MTLWGGMEMQYSPGPKAYKQREAIPALDRCEHCDGLGLVRIKFSGCFGDQDSRGSKDWQQCYNCDGDGQQPEPEDRY